MKKSRKPALTPGRAASGAPSPDEARAPTYDDVIAIVRLIESGSRFSEFRLRSGDIEVEVKRPNGAGGAVAAPGQAVVASAEAATLTPSHFQARERASEPLELPHDTQLVHAPMVGTFYRAPEPAAPPFVDVGSRVEPDTVVGILEVMKLMNSITAGVAGVVTHVLVANAQPVEFGQPLIGIRRE